MWWSVIVCFCVEMDEELSEVVRRGDVQAVMRFGSYKLISIHVMSMGYVL